MDKEACNTYRYVPNIYKDFFINVETNDALLEVSYNFQLMSYYLMSLCAFGLLIGVSAKYLSKYLNGRLRFAVYSRTKTVYLIYLFTLKIKEVKCFIIHPECRLVWLVRFYWCFSWLLDMCPRYVKLLVLFGHLTKNPFKPRSNSSLYTRKN